MLAGNEIWNIATNTTNKNHPFIKVGFIWLKNLVKLINWINFSLNTMAWGNLDKRRKNYYCCSWEKTQTKAKQ